MHLFLFYLLFAGKFLRAKLYFSLVFPEFDCHWNSCSFMCTVHEVNVSGILLFKSIERCTINSGWFLHSKCHKKTHLSTLSFIVSMTFVPLLTFGVQSEKSRPILIPSHLISAEVNYFSSKFGHLQPHSTFLSH